MADLTYLNEGAVLHNLKERYYYRLIYVSIKIQTILITFFSLSLFFSTLYSSLPLYHFDFGRSSIMHPSLSTGQFVHIKKTIYRLQQRSLNRMQKINKMCRTQLKIENLKDKRCEERSTYTSKSTKIRESRRYVQFNIS